MPRAQGLLAQMRFRLRSEPPAWTHQAFSPASLPFGSVQVNAISLVKSVSITNNMPVDITNFGLTLSGEYLGAFYLGDYALSDTTCPLGGTLAAQSSCTAFIYFQPTNQAGSISGSLAVTGSQLGSPQLLPLSGNGN